jgi:murein DD-endopeptidase MepM/ murein hydrolase activator NlpD
MRDFKSYPSGRKKPGKTRLVIGLLLALAFGSVLLIWFFDPSSDQQPDIQSNEQEKTAPQDADRITVPLQLPGQQREEGWVPSESSEHQNRALSASSQASTRLVAQDPHAERPNRRRISYQVAQGDTLSSIFAQLDLSASLLHRIVQSSERAADLTHIKPGEMLHVELDAANNLLSLTLEHDKIHSLEIQANETGFHCLEQNKDLELRTAHIQGIIEDSLYLSAKRAGLSDTVIMQLAEIFGWDIDFALEIRNGDRFSVIYQEAYLDGEKLRNGPILAAEFINQGRSYRAFRYTDEQGKADYFTPDGHSMRKAFLRAPVDFRRISSRFSKERWHPVLGKKRPHRGVDYAARTGTPIKAAGDGKIIYRGKKGGYGRTVIIQHAQNYTTLYAHLSRYNKQAKRGAKVKQGQVVGYVGQSGLATGPHLHYEFRVNGVHRNPLTVKLPDAEPIAKEYLTDFLLQTQPLVAQLDTLNRIMLADAR